jgi:CRP/FNR family transcriptional regulator
MVDRKREPPELREREANDVLSQCLIFKNLPPEKIREISLLATPVRFKKGSLIFNDGDPSNYLFIVQKGLVKLCNTSASGKSATFHISTRGDTLNGSALFTDSYFMSAQAMSDVSLFRVRRNEFLAFVTQTPSVAIEIIRVTARRLKSEYERMIDFQREEVEQRMVRCLLTLASKFGTTLSLTREELADFVGTTTETAIRVMSRLKKKGIVSCSARKGEIVISDLAKLDILAKHSHPSSHGE